MMTREEFLEAYNAEGEAEALLTQYDLEQAQEKIDGYIGNYLHMQEYLEEYLDETFPDFADQYGSFLDYEKLADHKLERELFSIDYNNRIYLFRR